MSCMTRIDPIWMCLKHICKETGITWRICKDMDNKTQTSASSKVNRAVVLTGENGIHFAVDHSFYLSQS